MKTFARPIRWLLGCAVLVAACSDDDDGGGPIDGTWTLAATECDGQTAQSPPFVLDVADTTGTFALTFAADCTLVLDEEYSYGDGTIEISPIGAACDPSAGCAGIGIDCSTPPPPVTFDFERIDDELVFSKPSAGPPADPCPAGQELSFAMTR